MRCTTPDYDLIYAPWLKNPERLLELVGYDPTRHSLLDLCGGTGAVSHAALTLRKAAAGTFQGPPITLMDLNPRQDCWERERHIEEVAQDLNKSPWRSPSGRPFDVVVCRQALGYIKSLPDFFYRVRGLTSQGGCFVFNAPAAPPLVRARKSDYAGLTYREFGICLFGRILHFQGVSIPPGSEKERRLWDISLFRHHPKLKIEEALKHHWFYEVQDNGKSLRFLCRPRPIGG